MYANLSTPPHLPLGHYPKRAYLFPGRVSASHSKHPSFCVAPRHRHDEASACARNTLVEFACICPYSIRQTHRQQRACRSTITHYWQSCYIFHAPTRHSFERRQTPKIGPGVEITTARTNSQHGVWTFHAPENNKQSNSLYFATGTIRDGGRSFDSQIVSRKTKSR